MTHTQTLRRHATPTRRAERQIAGVTLSALHPAHSSGRSIFPSRIFDPSEVRRVLKDGHQSRKIGKTVTKGPRRGWPIFTLTLEERATCPRTCKAWAFCFAPETWVLRADLSWSRIDQLKPGDKIIGFDEESVDGRDRAFRTATIDALKMVTKARVTVSTDSGDITVTADHLFLARHKHSTLAGRKGFQWLRAGDLKPDAQILFLSEPWDFDDSYDAARVRGFVEGEGCIGTDANNGYRKTRLSYAQRPGILLDEINAAVRRLGFDPVIRHVRCGVNNTEVAMVEIAGGWREAVRFLGRIRPTRLLQNAEGLIDGHSVVGRSSRPARIFSVDEAETGPVFEIATSTKTLIANGFLAHNCYGNSMQAAERIVAGDALEEALWSELAALQDQHAGGFMVRLHILGDFYSEDYVRFWTSALDRFPALHVFGFTARLPGTPMGDMLWALAEGQWDRFAIRFSGLNSPMKASVIQGDDPPIQAIPCPAQTGAAECCASCMLCIHSQRSISFARH